MATLQLDDNQATYQIRAYQAGTIRVNEKILQRSIIITPEHLIEDWAPQSLAELTSASLDPIKQLKPDILLIGTGSQLIFLAQEIYGHLINLGIGVEVMNTPAACRTFNALSAEGRQVAAALIIR